MLILDKSSPLRVEKLLILLHVERRGWGRGGEEGEGEGGKIDATFELTYNKFSSERKFCGGDCTRFEGQDFFFAALERLQEVYIFSFGFLLLLTASASLPRAPSSGAQQPPLPRPLPVTGRLPMSHSPHSGLFGCGINPIS